MSAEWATVLVTIVAAAATGAWAVWTSHTQRIKEAQAAQQRRDTLYLNPTLFAAEDLQSRLYNLLAKSGLGPLRTRFPDGRYATETVYLLARYFAWEQLLLRFTQFARDPEVIRQTRSIRESLSSDADGVDPWCVFRTTQTALGQEVLVWRVGEVGFADLKPLPEFDRRLRDGLAAELGLVDAIGSLEQATHIDQLPLESRRRLALLQCGLVGLLKTLEGRERISVFTKGERKSVTVP